MDNHLDLQVRLNPETESSLYAWSVSEHDRASGEKKSADLIPWSWSIYFKATRIKLHRSIGEGGWDAQSSNASSPFYDRERIRAELVLDTHSGPNSWNGKTSFSMLGTTREIEDITLEIYRLTPGEAESCRTAGGVEHRYEVDFHKRTQPDWFCIEISLQPERFDRLSAQLESGVPAEITLQLSNASGFYAQWSPSIYTDEIKVLGSGCLEGAEIPKDYTLPELGKVEKFALVLNREAPVVPQADDVEVDANTQDERGAAEQEAAQATQLLQAQEMGRQAALIATLRKPLWVIVALLAAILLFK